MDWIISRIAWKMSYGYVYFCLCPDEGGKKVTTSAERHITADLERVIDLRIEILATLHNAK